MSTIKPVETMHMPTDLADQTNGSVSPALLSPCGIISGYAPHLEFNMHHLAARAMKAMLADAYKAGVVSAPVWATGVGRTYNQQVEAFDGQHYPTGRYLPQSMWGGFVNNQWALPTDIRPWEHHYWKRMQGTAMAAIPGTSNHGWYLAVDFWNITQIFLLWLVKNAGRFGFSAEAQSEDWHWRYHAGDAVPQAVLDFEGTNQEEEMSTARLVRFAGFINVFLCGGGGPAQAVGGKDYEFLVNLGVPKVFSDHKQEFLSVCRQAGLDPNNADELVPGGSMETF